MLSPHSFFFLCVARPGMTQDLQHIQIHVKNNCTKLTCTWTLCWIVSSLQLPVQVLWFLLWLLLNGVNCKDASGISHVTLLLPVVLYVLCGRLLIARLSSFPRQPSAEPLCPPLTRLATVLRRPDRERGADFCSRLAEPGSIPTRGIFSFI
jgi:hypothetical protein